jgi:hypothetical protein
VRDGGAYQLIDGRVVHDLAVDHDAAVPVVRVLAEADVGDDEELGQLALDGADRGLHWRFGIVGVRSDVVLVLGNAEEQDAVDAVGLRRCGFFDRFIDRQVADARHRGHFAADALALADEQRQHEHVG